MSRIAILFLFAAPLLAQETGRVLRVYAVGGLAPHAGRMLEAWMEPRFGLLGPVVPHQEGREEWYGPGGEGQDLADITGAVRELIQEVAGDSDLMVQPSGHLLVWASEKDHGLIAQLLETLHRQCGGPFAIEVRYLSVRAGLLDDATRRALVDGVLDAAAMAALVKLDGARGARGGTVLAPHGNWTSYRAVRERRYMPEFDVEIAQASAIPDPYVVPASEGVQVSVRPFLLQDGSVLLRIFAAAGEIERMRRFRIGFIPGTRVPREPLTADVGEVEQVDFRGGFVSTQTLLPADGTAAVVLGSAEGEADARWDLLLFTLREAPRPATAGTLTVLPLGALCAPDDARFVGFPEESRLLTVLTADGPGLALMEPDRIAQMFVEEEGFLYEAPWLHGGSLLMRGTAGQARHAMATVAALEREFLRKARVSIRLSGDPAGPAWGLLGGPVVAESSAAFAAYRSVDLIGDYDTEVAQESRIADPQQEVAFGGAAANVTLHRVGPRQWRVSLELRVMALEPVVEVSHGSTEIGPLQDAPVQTRVVKTLLDVADGGEAVLDLGANPYGAGRLYAIVHVNG